MSKTIMEDISYKDKEERKKKPLPLSQRYQRMVCKAKLLFKDARLLASLLLDAKLQTGRFGEFS